jgi:hypothetical protein
MNDKINIDNNIIFDLFKELEKPNSNKTERTINFYRVGRKQGALEELKSFKSELEKQLADASIEFLTQMNGGVNAGYQLVIKELEKRIKELEGEKL